MPALLRHLRRSNRSGWITSREVVSPTPLHCLAGRGQFRDHMDSTNHDENPWLTALEGLAIPLWLTDAQGRVRWMNDSSTKLFGDSSGRHFSGFLASDRVNDERELFARRILGHPDGVTHPTVVMTQGRRLEAELVSVPLRRDSEVTGVLFALRLPPSEIAEDAARRRALPRLTPRQFEVLSLLSQGKSTRQIADELGIAEETARNHIRLLLIELRVHSRLEAVVVAFRNGWL